jgi:phosphate uptake regulator
MRLLEMGSLVETAIEHSIRGVIERDQSAVQEVLAAEARINAIELEIDALAIELLALHQPMASNLRFIIAALKINTDLERMGDGRKHRSQRESVRGNTSHRANRRYPAHCQPRAIDGAEKPRCLGGG